MRGNGSEHTGNKNPAAHQADVLLEYGLADAPDVRNIFRRKNRRKAAAFLLFA